MCGRRCHCFYSDYGIVSEGMPICFNMSLTSLTADAIAFVINSAPLNADTVVFAMNWCSLLALARRPTNPRFSVNKHYLLKHVAFVMDWFSNFLGNLFGMSGPHHTVSLPVVGGRLYVFPIAFKTSS